MSPPVGSDYCSLGISWWAMFPERMMKIDGFSLKFCSQVIYWFKEKLLHERNLPVFHGLFCFFPASKLNHSHLVFFFLWGNVKDVEFFGQLRKQLERKNQLNWWIFIFSPLRFGSIFESDECLVFSRYVLKIGVKPIILFRKLRCREHMSLTKKVMATKKSCLTRMERDL